MIKVDVPSLVLLVDKGIQVWLFSAQVFFVFVCWQVADY